MFSRSGKIRKVLKDTIPSCLAGFDLQKPAVASDNPDQMQTRWALRCSCKSDRGRLLGYPLSKLNLEPAVPDVLMSPLAFACSVCGKVTELLDTDQHGYSAEASRLEGSSGGAKFRGSGQREEWHCPYCGDGNFHMTAELTYWSLGELEEFRSSWENLFNEFEIVATCVGQKHRSEATGFGKL